MCYACSNFCSLLTLLGSLFSSYGFGFIGNYFVDAKLSSFSDNSFLVAKFSILGDNKFSRIGSKFFLGYNYVFSALPYLLCLCLDFF